MISISTLPETILSPEKKAEIPLYNAYVHPIFTQDWRMFYPCATTEGKFKMKIHYKEEVIDWFYITENDYKWYKWLRFTHHGELCLIEFNYGNWLWYDLKMLGWVIGDPSTHDIKDFKSTYSYHQLKNYAYSMALRMRDEQPVKVEVICEIRDVVSDKMDVFKFPDYTWKK